MYRDAAPRPSGMASMLHRRRNIFLGAVVLLFVLHLSSSSTMRLPSYNEISADSATSFGAKFFPQVEMDEDKSNLRAPVEETSIESDEAPTGKVLEPSEMPSLEQVMSAESIDEAQAEVMADQEEEDVRKHMEEKLRMRENDIDSQIEIELEDVEADEDKHLSGSDILELPDDDAVMNLDAEVERTDGVSSDSELDSLEAELESKPTVVDVNVDDEAEESVVAVDSVETDQGEETKDATIEDIVIDDPEVTVVPNVIDSASANSTVNVDDDPESQTDGEVNGTEAEVIDDQLVTFKAESKELNRPVSSESTTMLDVNATTPLVEDVVLAPDEVESHLEDHALQQKATEQEQLPSVMNDTATSESPLIEVVSSPDQEATPVEVESNNQEQLKANSTSSLQPSENNFVKQNNETIAVAEEVTSNDQAREAPLEQSESNPIEEENPSVESVETDSGEVELKPGELRTDKYSIIINTFQNRDDKVAQLLHRYRHCKYLDRIIVIWNDFEREVPEELARYPIKYGSKIFISVQSSTNITNRFRIQKQSRTVAQFSTDEDILYSCEVLDYAFQVWQSDPEMMVGFAPRPIVKSGRSFHYRWNGAYKEEEGYKYNTVWSTKGAFLHRRFYELYINDEYFEEVRLLVDRYITGEDILMAFIHAIHSKEKRVMAIPVIGGEQFKELRMPGAMTLAVTTARSRPKIFGKIYEVLRTLKLKHIFDDTMITTRCRPFKDDPSNCQGVYEPGDYSI